MKVKATKKEGNIEGYKDYALVINGEVVGYAGKFIGINSTEWCLWFFEEPNPDEIYPTLKACKKTIKEFYKDYLFNKNKYKHLKK